jgi:H+/Cl- antiporter ClcA
MCFVGKPGDDIAANSFFGSDWTWRSFRDGLETSGLFLILIGLLKMIATKANTATGWKGGEFFPVMFSSAAVGLGISNLIPGIHPMVAIAALMAATVTIVMDNIYIAVAVVLLFLPINLVIPMVVASLVAMFATKNFHMPPKLVAQEVSVKSENDR